MNNSTRQKLSIITLIITLIICTIYIYSNRHNFPDINKIRKIYIIHQVILYIFLCGSNGYITKIFAELFNIKLRIFEWFGLNIVANMINHFTPMRGGLSVKAVYLKKKHNLLYSKFLSIVAVGGVIMLLTDGTLGLISIFIIYLKYKIIERLLVIFFCSIIIIAFISIYISPSFIMNLPILTSISSERRNNGSEANKWYYRLLYRILDIMGNIFDGWNHIRSRPIIIIKVALTLTLMNIFGGLQFYFAYRAISIDIDFPSVILISIISALSTFVSITPGNLGIQEALIGFSSTISGITGIPVGFNEGLIVGAIVRFGSSIVIFVLGPIFSYLLLSNNK